MTVDNTVKMANLQRHIIDQQKLILFYYMKKWQQFKDFCAANNIYLNLEKTSKEYKRQVSQN